MFDEVPTELAYEPLVLRVKMITPLEDAPSDRWSAWAEVTGVEKGAFSEQRVRIETDVTTCGPFQAVGDIGLIIGHLETAADGQSVFIPQLDSPYRRMARKQKSRP